MKMGARRKNDGCEYEYTKTDRFGIFLSVIADNERVREGRSDLPMKKTIHRCPSRIHRY